MIVLVISPPGRSAYSILFKMASGFKRIVWLTTNPTHTPRGGNVRVIGFVRGCDVTVNPMNLKEIFSALTGLAGRDGCVILACLSELLTIHDVGKIFCFLIRVINSVENVLCLMLKDAQRRRDEIILSTLFDRVIEV